jgi:hypothetical protein
MKPVADRMMSGSGNHRRHPETPNAEENARLDREADRDFEHGRGIALKDAVAWVRSWFTPHEAPRPKPRKMS